MHLTFKKTLAIRSLAQIPLWSLQILSQTRTGYGKPPPSTQIPPCKCLDFNVFSLANSHAFI